MLLQIFGALLASSVTHGGIATEEFPHKIQDYDAASVVVIDAPSLAALSDAQLHALLDFSGSCGRVLLVDATETVQSLFRSRAACSARYLLTATSAEDLPALQRQLGQLPPADTASTTQLEQIVKASIGATIRPGRLAFFLAGYLLLMMALLARKQTRFAALGFSIIAAMLIHLLWPPASIRAIAAWAEAGIHEHVAAYEAIERTSTFRDGKYLRDDTRTRGSFASNPVLDVALSDDSVTVCNTGSGMGPVTHASWQGKVFQLPPLSPGESWRSANAIPVIADAPELALLLDRTKAGELALIQPLPVSDSNGSGWLRRHGVPNQDRTSCDS